MPHQNCRCLYKFLYQELHDNCYITTITVLLYMCEILYMVAVYRGARPDTTSNCCSIKNSKTESKFQFYEENLSREVSCCHSTCTLHIRAKSRWHLGCHFWQPAIITPRYVCIHSHRTIHREVRDLGLTSPPPVKKLEVVVRVDLFTLTHDAVALPKI